jgi:hypothetical protein
VAAVLEASLGALPATRAVRLAAPGEFTRRRFDAGLLNLTEAEGVADLTAARSEAARAAAAALADGALTRALAGWRAALVDMLALAEAAIDFEDDPGALSVEGGGGGGGTEPASLTARLPPLAASLAADLAAAADAAATAELARSGVRVALAGRPNAGKSSLANALARRAASIVSAVPGTTRDVVATDVVLGAGGGGGGGTHVVVCDAAGVRGLVIGAIGRLLAGGAGTDMPAPALMQQRPSMHLWSPRPQARGGIAALPLPEPLPFKGGLAEAQLPLHAEPYARMLSVPETRSPHPLGAPVAQVLDTYVIAVAADDSLVLVDQHAAHERLMHESIRTQMLDGGVRTQPLLLPAVVDLPIADASRLLARTEELGQLGLEIEAFGPGAILVRALPAALGAPEPGPLLRDLADELEEMEETTALSSRLDAVISRLACHGSIRAGRRLNVAEMDSLLRQMEATPRAATCSHGRPTFLKLSKLEIEKLFGRR